MNGLVFFDYDGTLVDERDQIYTPTMKTRQTIRTLQENGYLCILATGRAQSYIPQGARELHMDGYITCNGACVSLHGKEIFHDNFSDQELQKLLNDFAKYDINFILENAQYCYVGDIEDSNYNHYLDNFHTPKDNFVQYIDFEQVKGKIEKVTLIFKNQEHLRAYREVMGSAYVIGYHRNCDTFDIAKPHINKGAGVKALITHTNVSKANTYAFGDGDNDVELLMEAGCGIAMGLHDERLDSVADLITGTVKDEGIYEAMKKLEVM